MVTAGAGWTQLTYTIGSEPVRGFTGNGILDSAAAPWYVLEHVTIAIDPADPKAGPYTVYLDDLSNAGTIFESWDAAANGSQLVFRQPTFSGSTGGNLTSSPNLAATSDVDSYSPSKADRLEFQFVDNAPGRWIRLTTNGTDAHIGAPVKT